MKSIALAILAFLAIGGSLSAQIELVKIDGTRSTTDKVTIEDGSLVSGDSRLDVNEFRLIDFGREVKAAGKGTMISLIGGGTLGASSLSLSDENFVLENVAGQIKLGVEAVTQIKFKNEDLPLYSNAKPKEDLDQLFVKIEGNYQTVPGIVDSISESKVVFIYDEDAIEFKTDDVFGLILAQGAESIEAEINGVVTLTDGSRINCLVSSLSASDVKATVGGVADVVFSATGN